MIPELRPEGIKSNAWRESEWCLFPDEDLDQINNLLSGEEWSHLEVILVLQFI